MNENDEKGETVHRVEPEFRGPFWMHPYFLYVMITILLFLFILVMGWIGLKSGWIPDRKIS